FLGALGHLGGLARRISKTSAQRGVYDLNSMRPMPVLARGPRRRSSPHRASQLILGCPRVCPQWRLAAMWALVKPQRKKAILHRDSEQRWPPSAEAAAREVHRAVAERLSSAEPPPPDLHFPLDGEYFMVATCDNDAAIEQVLRALAVALS